MRLLAPTLALLLVAPAATAQITFQGGSFQTSLNTTMPGCVEDAGGVGISPAASSCQAGGYSAVAAGAAGFTTHTSGGEVTASGDAEASSTGGPPPETSSGSSNNTASASWTLVSDSHYSLSIQSEGGAFGNFSGPGVAFPPPSSGVLTILMSSSYGINVSVNVSAVADDDNGAEVVAAIPQSGVVRVTFAEVGSLTLIRGTVLAGGDGIPDLLIQASDGVTVVATTLTGDDGSYLLPDIGTNVTLQISDPAGAFATEMSPLLAPPATFDADLEDAPSVPSLSRLLLAVVAGALMLMGTRAAGRRSRA